MLLNMLHWNDRIALGTGISQRPRDAESCMNFDACSFYCECGAVTDAVSLTSLRNAREEEYDPRNPEGSDEKEM